MPCSIEELAYPSLVSRGLGWFRIHQNTTAITLLLTTGMLSYICLRIANTLAHQTTSAPFVLNHSHIKSKSTSELETGPCPNWLIDIPINMFYFYVYTPCHHATATHAKTIQFSAGLWKIFQNFDSNILKISGSRNRQYRHFVSFSWYKIEPNHKKSSYLNWIM